MKDTFLDLLDTPQPSTSAAREIITDSFAGGGVAPAMARALVAANVPELAEQTRAHLIEQPQAPER